MLAAPARSWMRFGKTALRFGSLRSVATQGGDVRVGNLLDLDGEVVEVRDKRIVKPGKGGAFAQLELKSVVSGAKSSRRLRTSETVDVVRLDEQKGTLLYREGETLVIMDPESYEQSEVSASLLPANLLPFLEDGMEMTVEVYKGRPISVRLPVEVVGVVKDTVTLPKGTNDTGYKDATLANGAVVKVPPHVATGERVAINTSDLSFGRRLGAA